MALENKGGTKVGTKGGTVKEKWHKGDTHRDAKLMTDGMSTWEAETQ